jgi:hypothetical protein
MATNSWVSRPLFAGDIQPGMRVVAGGGWGNTFGPATVLPDGLVELPGGMVAVKAMGDDGQIGVLTVPAFQAVMELVDVPPLDDRCDCGGPDCGGAWPTLDRDPHPPPKMITGGRLVGIGGRSILDAFIARHASDCSEDCCPTRLDPDPGECSDRPDPPPYEPGGYL